MAETATRRTFLGTLGASLGTGLTLGTGCGNSGELDDQIIPQRPRPDPYPAGSSCPAPASVTGTVPGPAAAAIGLNQAVQLPGMPSYWVCRDDRGLFALDTHCTHAGCLVNFVTATSSWLCPCHGSQYALDGTVTMGPAPRSLARYAVCKMDDGTTLIDTNKKI